ncbi:TIGR01777 family oxidoreductase [Modestobacter sp. I12A-02662]|uniref:TIGR01777 family oxidoreductase n=1 Tax=Modestobacter sp. I12A-02662 TaxID=1730496 RepID=UPI0034DF8A4B
MKVALTGSSGLIGSALAPALRADGHEVLRLVRRTPRTADEHRWDPVHHRVDPALLLDVDAVINLAGEPIRPRPWTRAYKERLRSSRLNSTTTIAEALAAAATSDPSPRRVLLSASGIDFYGDTGSRTVTERDPAGSGFLATLCTEWEAATAPAEEAGVRVAHLRTGLVVGPGATLMRIMGLVFRVGLGGRLGNGRQYWPWISLQDEVDAIRFLLTAEVAGPVNLTAPTPVTNAEFTRALAQVLHRPAVLPVPGIALRLALGSFAREAVLGGKRAVPAALTEAGFQHTHRDLEQALRAALTA